MKPQLLILSGSLRRESYNSRVAKTAEKIWLEKFSAHWMVETKTLGDWEVPVFNEDLESAPLPAGVSEMVEVVSRASAFVICSPEYNGGIAGGLKNALDWISRDDQDPLRSKPALLLSASPGALGGIRGLWHTRVPLEALGVRVYPDMMAWGKAHETLGDPKMALRLEKLLADFEGYSSRLLT